MREFLKELLDAKRNEMAAVMNQQTLSNDERIRFVHDLKKKELQAGINFLIKTLNQQLKKTL